MHTHADLLTKTANIFQFMEGKMMYFSILLSYEVYTEVYTKDTLFSKVNGDFIQKTNGSNTV